MIGQQPGDKARRTRCPRAYIPLSFYFDEFVDQNGNNITGHATTITDEIKTSPLFENASTATGNTQSMDARCTPELSPLFNKEQG